MVADALGLPVDQITETIEPKVATERVQTEFLTVEAGQADLFLSGYLGIGSITRGLAMYRLLDAVVTFHRELPRAGETVRYDIRIERFFQQGETRFFRFPVATKAGKGEVWLEIFMDDVDAPDLAVYADPATIAKFDALTGTA